MRCVRNHCNPAEPPPPSGFCGNSDANLPAVSLKNRKRGSSKVFFRFEMPLGFTGICATHEPWRVSNANDTTSTAWGDAAIEP